VSPTQVAAGRVVAALAQGLRMTLNGAKIDPLPGADALATERALAQKIAARFEPRGRGARRVDFAPPSRVSTRLLFGAGFAPAPI